MKKLIVALGLGVLMGTSAMAVPASPPPDSGNGAWITNSSDGIECGWNTQAGLMLGIVHEVRTKSGNTKYICKGELDTDEPPEKVVKEEGFVCWIISRTAGLQRTTDTKSIVTPSGEARLECSFKANQVDDGLGAPI